MNKIEIYNLQFEPYINEYIIGNYKFKRIENYKESFDKLMQLVNSSGSEFKTKVQTGNHQITAFVEIPHTEKSSVLPWGDKKTTQLDDILFLFSLFTGRNVFKNDWNDKEETAILQDHRLHHYGGQLICSIKYESRWKNKNTNEIKTKEEIAGVPLFDYHQINIGFEKTINNILALISSKKWQQEYEGGYFLFLFKSAIQRQIIETSFILCWTIWEHIFAIKNRAWLSDNSIEKMSGSEKINFILNKYFLKEINDKTRQNIARINKTRNRLIHFGKKTENVDIEEMNLFIRLTEQLMAIILNLTPSNIFNSFEHLDKFLKK